MLDAFQKTLRKQQTEAEQFLWRHLRNCQFYGFKFRRQQIIQGYIVDFVCLEKKLVIELDGSQHGEQTKYDAERTHKLEEDDYQVLRFWNNKVFNNTRDMLAVIYDALMV